MNNLKKSMDNLVWIDLEMTGLDATKDRILEIAVIVTDSKLEILEEGPVLAIKCDESVLVNMDDWNKTTHGQSGLLEKVRSSQVSEQSAEDEILKFLSQYCMPGKSPICGNSVHVDKKFIEAYMPGLYNFLHYRIIDVSSVKMLVKMWRADLKEFQKAETHTALRDIRESIEELKFYKNNIF